jgi:ubiquinone/menaquinone biosynthesis C-methylase UbiE
MQDETLWHDYAQVYDEVLNVLPYRNLLLELVGHAAIGNGMRLLDACCGTGNLLWALNQQGVNCEVTGIDSSPDMLERVRPKISHYAGSVNLVEADMDAPVDKWGTKDKFDRFIFNNCLCLIKEPSEVLKKAAAIARPGAILVASTPRPNPNINELLEEHLQLSEEAGISREDALQRMMPKLQPILACNERLMKRYGDSYHLPSEPKLREWFNDSGWEITELTTAYASQNWLVAARLAKAPA